MDKKAKIYVAGHTGLVGSAIIRRLKHLKYNNIIFRDINELDLIRQSETEQFFCETKPEYVFLAAALVGGIHANNTYKGDFIYKNLMISSNIIHSCYKFGVRKLINLGSSCIYPKHAHQPLKEEFLLSGKLEPTNEPYAIAKISAIKMCKYYNEQFGTNFISVMPTNLYGPNDNFNLENSHVLPALLRKFHLAKLLNEGDFKNIVNDFDIFGNSPKENIKSHSVREISIVNLKQYNIHSNYVTLWGSGLPYREFLYVEDLAEACIYLMNNYDAAKIGELINVGVGKDLQISELAEIIRNIVGYRGEIKWNKSMPDGTPQKLLDISKINKIGWRSKTDLIKGLELTYDFYLKKSGVLS